MYSLGMLDGTEIGRRIKAARELRGLDQEQLAQLMAEDGHGITDVQRLERGIIELTRTRRDSLIRHLGVPERWFSAEDADTLLGYLTESEPEAELISVRQELGQLRAAFEQFQADTYSEVLRAMDEFVNRSGREVGRNGGTVRSVHGTGRQSKSLAGIPGSAQPKGDALPG